MLIPSMKIRVLAALCSLVAFSASAQQPEATPDQLSVSIAEATRERLVFDLKWSELPLEDLGPQGVVALAGGEVDGIRFGIDAAVYPDVYFGPQDVIVGVAAHGPLWGLDGNLDDIFFVVLGVTEETRKFPVRLEGFPIKETSLAAFGLPDGNPFGARFVYGTPSSPAVPDGGPVGLLLASGIAGLGLLRRRIR
jgi:hypothetical protein